MSMKKITLELKGHYEGQTTILGGIQFTDGKVTLAGPEPEIDSLARYLFRCYQAVPEGTHWPMGETTDGTSEIYQEERDRQADDFSGKIQQAGAKFVETTSDDGEGSNTTKDNISRDNTDGGGQPNSRNDKPKEGLNNTSHLAVNPEKLLKAMESLDHNNPSQWTLDGLPRIDAVEKAYGASGITRADLKAVWPELVRKK